MHLRTLTTTGGKALFALAALLASQVALAETRAGACAGCDSQDMKRLAQRLTDNGTAMIFDPIDGQVETYRVFTQFIPGRYGRRWSNAVLISTDPEVRQAWEDYVYALEGLGDDGAIVLPPDFPVRSVAGALLDPAYTTTGIENHLLSLPQRFQVQLTAKALAARLKDVKTPFFDLDSIISSIVLTVRFPDGSTMGFTIDFSADQMDLNARIELSAFGNAMLADGSPAPTSALSFRDRSFRDNGGSLIEWVALARSFGISVRGDDGTSMECGVSGTTIVCFVKHDRR